MKQYMLSVHHDADFYGDDAPEMSPEEMQAMYEGVAKWNILGLWKFCQR